MANIFKFRFDREVLREKVNENIEVLSQNKMFDKLFNFIRTRRILIKICSLCLICILSVIVSLVSTGVTFGFEVKYGGSVIATIKDATVFNDAKDIVVSNVESYNADIAIEQPKLNLTLTVADRLDSAFKVADAIIENTNDIVIANALKVNGEISACVEDEGLEDYIEYCRNRFNILGAENESHFIDNITVEEGYYLKSDIKTLDEVKPIIEELQVKTTSVVNSDTEIPFDSKSVKTDQELIGYQEITTAGENGIQRKTETVETINGVEASRVENAVTVVKEPVTQITTVGTAKSVATASQRKIAGTAGFISPINSGSFRVSAYYGDGRSHKGVDLAANCGTSIFAVAGGTVTYAGFDGDYGYSVIIDHGNGLSTRYAHASSLCVSKGDKVTQGDLIALVGRTGYATGNHLHFEVMVNGSNVDPAPFIGLG